MDSEIWWMTWLSGLALGFALGVALLHYLTNHQRTALNIAEVSLGDLRSKLSLQKFFVTDLEYQVKILKRDLCEAWAERKKLDRRIRNQRAQLRMNWEILEMRNADHHRQDVRSRMLARCVAYREQADRASAALAQIGAAVAAAEPQPERMQFSARDETDSDRSSEEDR